MNRSLLSFSIAFFFAATGYLNAQGLSQDIARLNVFELSKAPSSTSPEEDEEENEWNLSDSLYHIPSYELYRSWNNKRVHPYKFDLSKMSDTVMIALAVDSCSFVAPFIGRKTSDFGMRRYRHHYGVDIKVLTGDPILSAWEGVVRISHYDRDYGNVVVVRHNNGLESLYAHLSKRKVQCGDWVEAGDLVGLGGNTGRSTGSHLHFEVRYLGEPINPNEVIDFEHGLLCYDTLHLNQEHFEYLKELRAIKYHRIRQGDTLSGIARRYGTTVSALCRLNGIRPSTTLRIGRSIRYN